jgi:hypothetical protein
VTNGLARTLLAVAGPILAGLVILSVWLPLWSHYHVAQPVLGIDAIRQSATEQPSGAVLQEISSLKHRLVPPIGPDVVDAVAVANALISDNGGRQSLFNPRLLGGLNFAGFETLWVLVSAYEQSGDLTYLKQARLFLLEFITYENAALLPQGRLSLWLVVDAFEDRSQRGARIVWGSDHDVRIQECINGAFVPADKGRQRIIHDRERTDTRRA